MSITLPEMITAAIADHEAAQREYREHKTIRNSRPVVCGRVSVRASSPPQGKFNPRLNFKVDGKRATEAQAMAALEG